MQPIKDPIATESYKALRRALLEIKDDFSALQSIISSLTDSGEGWIRSAFCELRRKLVHGRLTEADVIGDLIGKILSVQERGENDELAANRIHRDCMRWVSDGIEAILAQDNLTGIHRLEHLTEAIYSDESLQWVAWYWISKAAIDEGDLDQAKESAEQAMALAQRLDMQAKGMSLCTSSEIEFLRDESDAALGYLAEATAAFKEVGDQRGMAMASLTLARMLVSLGREEEGLRAAWEACEADQDWEDPLVFLSQRALIRKDIETADELLRPFNNNGPRSPEIDRQRQLIVSVAENRLPVEVVAEFLRLKERPPLTETNHALEALWTKHPDFLQLRELLAWNLVKTGCEDVAAKHFKKMAYLNLTPEMQSSVLLGLGCLANRKHRHRQPARRVKAASASFRVPKSLEIVEDPALEDDMSIPIIEAIPLRKIPQRLESTEFDAVDPTESLSIDDTLDASLEFQDDLTDCSLRSNSIARSLDTSYEVEERTAEGRQLPPEALLLETEFHELDAEPLVTEPKPDSVPSAVPVVEPKAVFIGDLQLFAVPDLLDFLFSSRRTGALVVTSEVGIGAVYLHQGWITGAASPNSANMGSMLIERGVVTSEQLKAAIASQQSDKPEMLLGAILVEMGAVDSEVMREALIGQVKGALLEIVEWTQGRFAFEPDKTIESIAPLEIEIKLDTRAMLFDVLREVDERNR